MLSKSVQSDISLVPYGSERSYLNLTVVLLKCEIRAVENNTKIDVRVMYIISPVSISKALIYGEYLVNGRITRSKAIHKFPLSC